VSAPAPFDVCGPLPVGVTVLEASAGTGKTFTIAALAARYVAEGTPLEHLLLVTFTRMATGELRERVRERLVTAERGLARAAEGIGPPEEDDVLVLLASARDDEIELRRRRLAAALADFDAATIATTHGFCQHMLSGLGVGGDVEADITFIEDPTDLIGEVVDDLYVRKFWRRRDPPFDRAEARRIGKIAVANPDAVLVPADADPDTDPAMRWRLAEAVRREVDVRKRRRKVLTYDDLLTRLASTLSDPARGPAACARLGERYRVAMVDEFQDTDSIQWEIMRRAFGGVGSTLVLIGDPKQAIYGFRGADVYAYLSAARAAETRATLAVNWRSDQPLIDAYDALLGGTKLGHEGIEYRTVRAADAHQAPRLRGAPNPAPLRMRIVHRGDGGVRLTPKGWVNEASARKHVAADLAADVVGLLASGAEAVTRSRDGSEVGAERVRPGHLAVLVATHRDAAMVREALDAVGVPAVINGAGSVFGTPIAREWLALLQALERPASPTRVRAAALTSFLGWTAAQVATADDAAWEQVYERIHAWADLLRSRGVASLLETITHAEALPRRMLSRGEGERELTDLRHLGQLLHLEATSEQLGTTALTAWLGRRIAEAREDTSNEDRSRRLESDSEAVQVLTIYASKGLEFPIVYCPYLWDPGWIPTGEPPVFHDPAAGDRRTIDIGGERPGFGDGWRQFLAEERGEELRLAYVALTRARHQAVVWWASSWDSRQSALARLLFPPDEGEPAVIELPTPPSEDDVITRLTIVAANAPGSINIERTTGGDGRRWVDLDASPAELHVRPFRRSLDVRWRRTSYTGLTARVHDDFATSEPDDAGITDEEPVAGPGPPADDAVDPDEPRLRAVSLPLAAMPGGTRIGSLVHSVLEHVDFSAADLTRELSTRLDEQHGWADDIGPAEAAVGGLQAAIETPLGPLVDDVRLRDIGAGDRLDELAFELPLVGGDAPTSELTLGAVARLLDDQLPPDDVLFGYGSRLRDPVLGQHVRGYLTGSLDAVLRVRASDGTPRYIVVDYKTNWLGDDGEALSAWHYRPSALATAMQRAHYPLQALFYAVALHRYLRWRQPGYDPERNLAGVLYLFLRGMTGADVPRVAREPCGVFGWRPPAALIVALSDLFDRGVAAA
jgi:exodeoxyribonuclease V beta subunit